MLEKSFIISRPIARFPLFVTYIWHHAKACKIFHGLIIAQVDINVQVHDVPLILVIPLFNQMRILPFVCWYSTSHIHRCHCANGWVWPNVMNYRFKKRTNQDFQPDHAILSKIFYSWNAPMIVRTALTIDTKVGHHLLGAEKCGHPIWPSI